MSKAPVQDKLPPEVVALLPPIRSLCRSIDQILSKAYAFPSSFSKNIKPTDCPDWSSCYTPEIALAPLKAGLSMMGYGWEELNQKSRDQFGQILKAVPRKLFLKSPNASESERSQALLRLLASIQALINDLACVLVHGERITDLLPLARTGDDAALFTILQMDKSLIGLSWVQARVRHAQLTANWKFLERFGKAVAMHSRQPRKQYVKLAFVLSNFWNQGLSKLTTPQLLRLLKQEELYSGDDPEVLRRFANRLGLRKFQKIST